MRMVVLAERLSYQTVEPLTSDSWDEMKCYIIKEVEKIP